MSPKKRNTVILLNFFFGIVGAHRFYLGKKITGVLMALTLGGLLFWSFSDLVVSIFGNCKDSKGRVLDKRYNLSMAIAMFVLSVLVMLCWGVVLYAFILPPLFSDLMKASREHSVASAYQAVIESEDRYFAMNSNYSDSYTQLREKAGLKLLPGVHYHEIRLVENSATGKQGVRFKVKHSKDPAICYEIDTSSEEPVKRIP
jgi:TM2 domain-containing membrane protein YozV